ncbi:hypothetical protein HY310_01400 [Candidatus Microgenomates bacterium]|nr:hypothetical protein [Candidatus Microgenomates bacterium]
MKKLQHLIRHIFDYLLLLVIFIVGFGGLLYFKYDIAAQIADVVVMCLFYIGWGVLHHFHDRNLSGKVFMEYVAIAALVAFILIIFLLRA